MRLFITGGTGFLGMRLVKRLRREPDVEIIALARSKASAGVLERAGCRVQMGDITDFDALGEGMLTCDGVIHVAAEVHTGISRRDRDHMYAVNVIGTTRLLEASERFGIRTTVVSTTNVLGNTRGKVVPHSYQRPADEPYKSVYEETKWKAHKEAVSYIERGMALNIVMPGEIYGPNDPSTIGKQTRRAASGRLRAVFLGGVGIDMVHVDDVVDGLWKVHTGTKIGEEYRLTGEKRRLREVLVLAARINDRRPPLFDVPDVFAHVVGLFGPTLQPLGFPANPREAVRVGANGATYWASYEKAEQDFGYAPRSLEDGLREVFNL